MTKTQNSNRLLFKIGIICILILFLLIPMSMIDSIIDERKQTSLNVKDELTSTWGKAQCIAGPLLVIPYKKMTRTSDGKHIELTHFLNIFPESLKINGTAEPEIRHRSIYEVILYKSQTSISGMFKLPDFKEFNIDPKSVIWNDIKLNVFISDMRGISNTVSINWNSKDYIFEPGILRSTLFESGIHSRVPVQKNTSEYLFSFDVNLNGSDEISFIPTGKSTESTFKSNWNSPSFFGAKFPKQHTITQNQFNAYWEQSYLSRNFPQVWSSETVHSDHIATGFWDSKFGVKFLQQNNFYQKNSRITKYAILFIVLTFLVFFLFEIFNKQNIHPLQYLLVGFALSLFYLITISFSEQFGFSVSYTIASIATIVLVTCYGYALFNKAYTSILLGKLIVLYTYLYILIQLEDLALILGTVGLFAILATVMYTTRKVDWNSIDKMVVNE